MSYTCENIEDGKTCGAPAEFTAITPWSRRNVCARCKYIFEGQGRRVVSIEEADGDRPAVAPLRIHHKADGSVELWCHCGEVGKIRASSRFPLCDAHAPPTPRWRDKLVDCARDLIERATGARARKIAAAESELIRRTIEAKSHARKQSITRTR